MRSMTPDATSHRNNLPWIHARRWTGPGTEVRNELLVRECNGLPDGAGVPEGFVDRVRSQQASLGRAGLGYLAHLALLRAERLDGASAAWLQARAISSRWCRWNRADRVRRAPRPRSTCA